jgi:hypothetical protein
VEVYKYTIGTLSLKMVTQGYTQKVGGRYMDMLHIDLLLLDNTYTWMVLG